MMINKNEFGKILWAMKARSTHYARPILQGINMIFTDDTLYIYGVDGYRAHRAIIKHTFDKSKCDVHFIIDPTELEKYMQLKTAGAITDFEIKYDVHNNPITVVWTGRLKGRKRTIETKTIFGQYPAVDYIIPDIKSYTTQVTINKAEINVLAALTDLPVTFMFYFEYSKVVIERKALNLSSLISSSVTGESVTIGINPQYMNDAMLSDNETIYLNGNCSPVVVKPSDHLLAVIMPASTGKK